MRAGSRFADAKRGALEVLSHRGGSQRAQVLVLGGKLEVLTQPIADSAQLAAAVASIQPGDGHGNFGELGRGMRAMAESVHTPIELHLFSDMQSSNMPGNFRRHGDAGECGADAASCGRCERAELDR